jgi:hypothetical protein
VKARSIDLGSSARAPALGSVTLLFRNSSLRL